MAKPSFIPVVEAAFTLTNDLSQWLWGIAEHSRPVMDVGLGVAALAYVLEDAQLTSECAVHVGCEPAVAAGLAEAARAALSGLPPQPLQAAVEWLSVGREPVTRLGALGETTTLHEVQQRATGFTDAAVVLGRGTERRGVVLLAPTRTPFFPTIRRRAALARFARQLGNAYSLRLAVTAARQPEESLADAFRRLATQGATGDGTSSEDWARWIDGSLSLVDSFEKDGRRYVVAMRSVPEAGDPRVLTAMERTVAGYAAHGYSNQLIAQTLGLGPSTIAGLLQRIVQKLGLAHRSQLPLLAATARLEPPDAAD